MTQTSIIAGSLLLAFGVFVITRGELPCYLQVLGVATDAQCPAGSVSVTGLQAPTAATGTQFLGGSVGSGGILGNIGVGLGQRIGAGLGNTVNSELCNLFGINCGFAGGGGGIPDIPFPGFGGGFGGEFGTF